jgi:hypothetical protein
MKAKGIALVAGQRKPTIKIKIAAIGIAESKASNPSFINNFKLG